MGRSARSSGPGVLPSDRMRGMTLRAGPLEHDARLPDGRVVHVRVGIPEDGYIRQKDLDTVTLELSGDGEHLAAVSTILEPDQLNEATALLREVVAGLESGELAPTAGAIEPLADTLPT
jgi:hypothetical protein